MLLYGRICCTRALIILRFGVRSALRHIGQALAQLPLHVLYDMTSQLFVAELYTAHAQAQTARNMSNAVREIGPQFNNRAAQRGAILRADRAHLREMNAYRFIALLAANSDRRGCGRGQCASKCRKHVARAARDTGTRTPDCPAKTLNFACLIIYPPNWATCNGRPAGRVRRKMPDIRALWGG